MLYSCSPGLLGPGCATTTSPTTTTVTKVSIRSKQVLLEVDLLQKPSLNHLPLAGRLKHCLSNWEIICEDPWVFQAVKGYQLDFINAPFHGYIPRRVSSDRESDQINRQGTSGPYTKRCGPSHYSTFHKLCLFYSPNLDRTSKIPQIYVEG